MVSDLFTLIIVLIFIWKGTKRPDILMCLLVWINAYKPQETSFGFLSGQPLSMYLTLYFFAVLVMNWDKVRIPRAPWYHILALGFMIIISLSTYFAHFPEAAIIKYDTAIKTLVLTYLIPFVITSKRQIEAFVWTAIISLGTFAFFGGVKSLLGGGGYGVSLISGSSMWGEGSIFTNQMLSLIPVCLYLYKSTEIVGTNKILKLLALGYAMCAILTMIGTQARSGLVCLMVLALAGWYFSKSKFKVGLVLAILPFMLLPLASDAWFERMSTIQSKDVVKGEASAMGRVMVWRWTIDYVADRPFLGGGFNSYLANSGMLQSYAKDGEVIIQTRGFKAFHNIIFEVLGEHGYLGLIWYLGILNYIFFCNFRRRNDNEVWIRNLSRAIMISMLVYCAGGMFVNYAIFPWLYFLFGITTSLNMLQAFQKESTKADDVQIKTRTYPI